MKDVGSDVGNVTKMGTEQSGGNNVVVAFYSEDLSSYSSKV